MSITNLKQYFNEVKATIKASKDRYIYLAILLTLFVTLLTFVFDYFVSGIIVILLYAVVAPFLMAVASYFVAPTKGGVEQKQKYFFRLVKQFYRLDSMRIMIPLRTFFFALIFSVVSFYFTVFVATFIASSIDPTLINQLEEFTLMIQNGASVEQLTTYFNANIGQINDYIFAAELYMIFAFVLAFSYMLVKRFFFVYMHVNLFDKSKLKIDRLKAKYFNRGFKTKMRQFYFPSVAPIFMLASVLYLATAILFYIFLGHLFSNVLILIAAASIYVIVLASFLPYLLTVNLVLFGLFMEINAMAMYQESINDIDVSVANPNLSNEEKERLLEIKKILEMQKVLFHENLKKSNEKEDVKSEDQH